MSLKQYKETRPQAAEREFFEKLQKVREDYGGLTQFYDSLRSGAKSTSGSAVHVPPAPRNKAGKR